MLQQVVIQRIVRIYRLRLLYGVHLALFGLVMVLCALNASAPAQLTNVTLVLMTWLPVLLLHTAVQTYNELRERFTPFEQVPAPAFSRVMLPVDLYDEDGNLINGGDNHVDLLPRPRAERR